MVIGETQDPEAPAEGGVRETGSPPFLRDGPGDGAGIPRSVWEAALRGGYSWDKPAGEELLRLLEKIERESRVAQELADGVLAPLKPFWESGGCLEFFEKPPPPHYPDAVQEASMRLPALFVLAAKGDRHAFALALESLETLKNLSVPDGSGFDETVWGIVALIECDLDDADSESDSWEHLTSWQKAVDAATGELLWLGMGACIGEAVWQTAIRDAADRDILAGGWTPETERLGRLLDRAVRLGCPDAMPAADSFREWRALEKESDFLSPEERCRRIAVIALRGWRFAGPLAGPRPPLPAGPAPDEFERLCREGEPLALASLARGALGDGWRGDAYGPWRPAPSAAEDAAAAEAVFRDRAAAGDALGCFYLGQLAWKETVDWLEAQHGEPADRTERHLLFLDRDRRFLELPCEKADRWFRRGAALGGRGARECERTLAWRAAAVRVVAG